MEQLNRLARAALDEHPDDREAALSALRSTILANPELMREAVEYAAESLIQIQYNITRYQTARIQARPPAPSVNSRKIIGSAPDRGQLYLSTRSAELYRAYSDWPLAGGVRLIKARRHHIQESIKRYHKSGTTSLVRRDWLRKIEQAVWGINESIECVGDKLGGQELAELYKEAYEEWHHTTDSDAYPLP